MRSMVDGCVTQAAVVVLLLRVCSRDGDGMRYLCSLLLPPLPARCVSRLWCHLFALSPVPAFSHRPVAVPLLPGHVPCCCCFFGNLLLFKCFSPRASGTCTFYLGEKCWVAAPEIERTAEKAKA